MEVQIKCKERIELVDPKTLKKHPDNNNIHTDDQLERLITIIKENGFTSPITVSTRNNCITKGHLRLDAALKMGLSQVPVIYNDYKNEKDEYADLTADNEIARWSELDRKKTLKKITELESSGERFNLDLLGVKDTSIFQEMEAQSQAFQEEMNSNYDDDIGIEPDDDDFIVDDKKVKEVKSREDIQDKYIIIVECDNEIKQENLFEELKRRNYKCKIMSDL
jgi:hypothetical protein